MESHNKVKQKLYGSFKVLMKKINDNAYAINLPKEMGMSRTFNVANISDYHPEVALYDHPRMSSFQMEENDAKHQLKIWPKDKLQHIPTVLIAKGSQESPAHT